ncbi:hypothetical protein I317_06226 [Kwoniella heveanensis CBS 569]|nr:hypothetical protein I317_06226 [Kwoniella heveanensis CBS 569]
MSAPIPISHTGPSTMPQHGAQPLLSPPLPSNTPGSSISVSPQTPFFPPPGLATSTTPTQSSGLFKWASSFGKSPNSQTSGNALGPSSPNKQSGFDVPPTIQDVEDHEHEHDSFEFGDYGDLKSRSWTASTGAGGRRAMSMSYAAGRSGQSGIAAMLKGGFGGDNTGQGISPPAGGGGPGPGQSMPVGGVMADKAAKGQGVLRRLSLSGTSYRPAFLSPPLHSAPLPPSPPAVPSVPAPAPAPAPPIAEPQLNRAATITGATTAAARGRRYSEGQKKRGVSPMGERLLRDHGHF